ncbi:hypothetical protein J4E93_002032 [Alternaria ventricosa]|uniref:uncharacterized protein n=1 Tax=Alternaria ventricosa TaxID=1187951 RepID=UPI0020C21C69|nr:uncharacterized protein J4E93_002032 [Alternaria ventricosa]KAI4651836.1 hypothetical protein J4E93_002032 [Alternaria ventricosa]
MHLPTNKLQLRPKLTNVLQHSSKTSTSKTPEAPIPNKTDNSVNIKDKRNIKIGIAALRTVSKWTDKAALTLEKLEGQEASKHCQDRQARLLAEDGSKGYGKQAQDSGVWRETVVYPVPTQIGSARAMHAHEPSRVYGAVAAPSSQGESHITAGAVEAPLVQTHHAHVLASVEEYYDESSDDEDEGNTSRQIGLNSSTNVDADDGTDEEDTSDDSSDDEKEDDSDDEKDSDEDSDADSDSEAHDSSDDAEDSDEEEVEAKQPMIKNAKK